MINQSVGQLTVVYLIVQAYNTLGSCFMWIVWFIGLHDSVTQKNWWSELEGIEWLQNVILEHCVEGKISYKEI